MKLNITDDYILGLVEGEGSFTFSTNIIKKTDSGEVIRRKVPAFMLQMHDRDSLLVEAVRDHLGLKNKIYNFRKPALISSGKIYKRGRSSVLSVREIGSLKNIIIPFFAHRLLGYRGIQFLEWINQIEKDREVPDSYKIISRLYRSGFYSKI